MFGFFRRLAGALHPFVAGLAAAASLLKPLPVEDGAAPGGWLRYHHGSGHRDGHKGEQVKRKAKNRRRNKLAAITRRQMRAKARR